MSHSTKAWAAHTNKRNASRGSYVLCDWTVVAMEFHLLSTHSLLPLTKSIHLPWVYKAVFCGVFSALP